MKLPLQFQGAGAAGTFTRLFRVPFGCDVEAAYVTCSAATSSSDGTDNWVGVLYSLTNSTNIATGIDTEDAELVAATSVEMTIVDSAKSLSAGDIIALVMTESGTATDLSAASFDVQIKCAR